MRRLSAWCCGITVCVGGDTSWRQMIINSTMPWTEGRDVRRRLINAVEDYLINHGASADPVKLSDFG